jgi:hypothetical protein
VNVGHTCTLIQTGDEPHIGGGCGLSVICSRNSWLWISREWSHDPGVSGSQFSGQFFPDALGLLRPWKRDIARGGQSGAWV